MFPSNLRRRKHTSAIHKHPRTDDTLKPSNTVPTVDPLALVRTWLLRCVYVTSYTQLERQIDDALKEHVEGGAMGEDNNAVRYAHVVLYGVAVL